MLQFPRVFEYPEPLIAFTGPMCSGKTYAAENLFKDYQRMSLAAPLKETAMQYYGVIGKTNNERKILQELADDLKKWDRDVFTKYFLLGLKGWIDYNEENRYPLFPIVVDDVRYVHEAEDLKRYGFTIVRVYIPEDVRQARVAQKYPDTDPERFNHPTEKDWKNIQPDYTILGEGNKPLLNLREAIQNSYR